MIISSQFTFIVWILASAWTPNKELGASRMLATERSAMSFIVQNKTWFRTFALVLFIISMLGIWSFELIPFPIPISSPCDTYNSLVGKSFLSEEHFIRLSDNNCVITISGFEIIYLFTTKLFFGMFIELIEGNFAAVQIPQLIAMIGVLLIILPFFSNILLFRNRYSRRLQIINIIAWGLACLLASSFFLLDANRDEIIKNFYLLWGLWLYILLALCTIIFEILELKSGNKSSMVDNQEKLYS